MGNAMWVLSEILSAVLLICTLIFFNVPLIMSSLLVIAYLAALTLIQGLTVSLIVLWVLALGMIAFLNLPFLRQRLITSKIFVEISQKLPAISETEQEVLAAGDVWW